MRKRLRAAAKLALALTVMAAAMYLLYRELAHYDWRDVVRSLRAIPVPALVLAVGLTALDSLVLIGYDFLALRSMGRRLPFRRLALASFLGYTATHNFGTFLGGATIRFRIYTAWGLTAVEIAKLVVLLGLTFWVGFFALASAAFLVDPPRLPPHWDLPFQTVRPLAFVSLSLVLVYVGICGLRRAPLRRGKWKFKPPSLDVALAQIVVASLQLTVAASVLYVLLPPAAAPSFSRFLSVYLLALVAALLTQAPGGLGVIEVVVLMLLDAENAVAVAGSLLAYRAVYFVLPLVVAVVLLTIRETSTLRPTDAREANLP